MKRESEMIWKSLSVETYHINNDISMQVNSHPATTVVAVVLKYYCTSRYRGWDSMRKMKGQNNNLRYPHVLLKVCMDVIMHRTCLN